MTIMMNVNRKKEMMKIMNNSIWDLPSPSSVNYFWNLGATLGVALIIQILTGLLLSFHYSSYSEESFSSIMKINREIWSGWLMRYAHMNGASMIFMFIYLHLFRGVYFMSSSHKKVWYSGVMIFLIIMSISFLGYVLPWGQMSFWAVAVITNLFSIIPMIGNNLVNWIWGGYSVGAPTLTRFYSLHFLLPLMMTLMVMIHLYYLHQQGSSNPVGPNSNMDKIQFHPYFTIKDLYFILGGLTMFMTISFMNPYMLGDSVNNVPANPMQTPIHIQPEWYFLTSYAILRALPSKTAGVVALALSVSIYLILPIFKFKFMTKFNAYRNLIFWIFISSFLFLMKMGALPAEEPYILMSKMSSMIYFTSIIFMNM